jgi:hypothetical protein
VCNISFDLGNRYSAGDTDIYAIGPLCQNSTAPLLPGTSVNGITGTWSPATINTATAGTTTYTFTSTDASQCATSASISVTVTPQVTPTFMRSVRSVRIVLRHCYLVLLSMVSPVHGVLQLLILQLPVPLLIHLHQLMPASVQHQLRSR